MKLHPGATTVPAVDARPAGQLELDELVRSFPAILESLRGSYRELEERSRRVERELCHANEELESKVRELDLLRGHLEAVLESLPCGVVVRDGTGKVTRVNGAAAAILGVEAGALTGSEDGHPLLAGPAADGEPRELVGRDGNRLVLSSHAGPVRLADGSSDGSVEILDDRTEEITLAERLHAADKMAALGTLAAGLAHEIRNPLNAVRGFAELLTERVEGATERRWCSLIIAGSGEADAIIESMLSFGSPERLRTTEIDPAQLIHETVRLTESSDNADVHVVTECDAPTFRGDAIKLRHALRNLLANAFQAVDGEGSVTVSALRDGDEIVLRVGDSGPGIPPAIRQRILDPFFTTRAQGTGLGLALVSIIAQLHGGSIAVGATPSRLGGAELELRIPYRPAGASAAPIP